MNSTNKKAGILQPLNGQEVRASHIKPLVAQPKTGASAQSVKRPLAPRAMTNAAQSKMASGTVNRKPPTAPYRVTGKVRRGKVGGLICWRMSGTAAHGSGAAVSAAVAIAAGPNATAPAAVSPPAAISARRVYPVVMARPHPGAGLISPGEIYICR